MDYRFDNDGEVCVIERTVPKFVHAFLFLLLLFMCIIMIGIFNVAHPLYLIILGILIALNIGLTWLSLSYKEVTHYGSGIDYIERITSKFGKSVKKYIVQINGYKEVQYGQGLITSATVGGHAQYVMLTNDNRECSFRVASVSSKAEAEEIADTVSQRLNLPQKKINWDVDPSFPSDIKGYCKYIRRVM